MLKPKETKKIKSSPSPCDSKRILQAISILKQLNQKYNENRKKKSLFDDESENPIILQLTMKKIPPPTMRKFVKVHLPISILSEKNEVCLITGDLDKRNTKAEVEPDVLHFKELLKKENISQVNEVITLRQLRKEYKPYEARRQLCGAYDVFLCDKRIAGVLPHTLGKCFFQKRKLPIQINMQATKLKEQIENALSSTVFHISCKGNSCASEVANLSMNDEDILFNIISSIDALKEHLPGQWNNVLGIYVKTPKSKAIPLYMSNDDPNEFNFTKKRQRSKAVTAELSTLADSDVKVFRDGRVVVKRPKKKVEDCETSELVEEVSSSDGKEQIDAEIEESSSLSASDSEVACDDADAVEEPKKKSKKRKSYLESNEERYQAEVKEEMIENSNVEEPRKKNKKRKSELICKEESSQSEVKEESIENSLVEKVKNKSKRKSNLKFYEECSQNEVKEESIENSLVEKVKNKSKRKSNLKFNEESAEVKVREETFKNSPVKSTKSKVKKNKNQN